MLLQANYPSLVSVKAMYIWLKENRVGDVHNVTDTSYIFEQALELEEWLEDGAPPHPKPNYLCRSWCPVITCEHNGGKK